MFMMQMSPSLSHGLIITDWLFLRSFNAVFSFNVRLLGYCRFSGVGCNSGLIPVHHMGRS